MSAFHLIMLVRDEADILPACLDHLLSWGDSLIVLDTGSTDDTPDILRDYAAREKRITLHICPKIRYHNGLRGQLFERYRARFRPGDWIARVDADEIYHIAPPTFVRERVSAREGMVCATQYVSVLTRPLCEAWARGEGPLHHPALSIEDRLRDFVIDPYPEQRLYRYRRFMVWPGDARHPIRPGLEAMHRIPVRHYRWRTPDQARARQNLRRQSFARGADVGGHWGPRGEVLVGLPPDAPGLFRWRRGEPLPTFAAHAYMPTGGFERGRAWIHGLPIIGDALDLRTRLVRRPWVEPEGLAPEDRLSSAGV